MARRPRNLLERRNSANEERRSAMSGIVWLASYPKSGNTWLRALIANYRANAPAPVPINELPRHCLSDNDVGPYVVLSGRDAAHLTPAEINRLRPEVHRRMAASRPDWVLVKTHSVLGALDGVPLITPDATRAAIYVVRNPLDVATSFADHYGLSIDAALRALDNDHNATPPASGVIFQFLSSWRQHVESWRAAPGLPLHVVRYEDMHRDPVATLRGVARFLGLADDQALLERAARFSRFDVLAEQERRAGFVERSRNSARFFRHGRIGDWRSILSGGQAEGLIERCRSTMHALGYLDADGVSVV